MTELLQYTVAGVTSGALYTLIALGKVVVFRASHVLFLVQGAIVSTAAMTVVSLHQNHHLPLGLAMVLTILISVAIAVAMDLVFVRRVPPEDTLNAVVLLFGLLLLVAEIDRRIFGPAEVTLRPFLPAEPIRFFGAAILPHQVLLVLTVALLGLCLWFIQERTMLGRALRACGDDPEGCLLIGIRPSFVRTAAFALAAVLAGVAGIVIAPLVAIGFSSGALLTVKGLIAAVLGAWTFPGAILAGTSIGLAESFTVGYLSSIYRDVMSLGLLVGYLVIRTFTRPRIRKTRVPRGDAASLDVESVENVSVEKVHG